MRQCLEKVVQKSTRPASGSGEDEDDDSYDIRQVYVPSQKDSLKLLLSANFSEQAIPHVKCLLFHGFEGEQAFFDFHMSNLFNSSAPPGHHSSSFLGE